MNYCFASEIMQAWEYALNNSSEIKAASEKYNIDFESKAQAQAQLLPTLQGKAYYQEQPQTNADDSKLQGWSVELSQALLNISKWQHYKKGSVRSVIAELELQNSRHQLLIKVTQIYFNTLQAKNDLDLIKKTKESILLQVSQAEALYKKGAGTIIDFYDAQSAYEEILAEEIAAHSKLEINLKQLSSITGFPYRTLQGDIMVFEEKGVPTLEYWKKKALNGSFAIQAKSELIKEAEYEVKAVKSQHLPVVDLNLGYQDNTHKRDTGARKDLSYSTRGRYVNIQMTVPLYSGGSVTSKTRAAVASRELLRHEYDNEVKNILLEVEEVFLDIKTSQHQIKAFTRLCDTNHTKLEATKIGLTAGVRTQIDLVKAERDYLEAQRKLSEAQYQLAYSYIQLQIISGEIDLSKIKNIVNVTITPHS